MYHKSLLGFLRSISPHAYNKLVRYSIFFSTFQMKPLSYLVSLVPLCCMAKGKLIYLCSLFGK